ncbi:MAG: 50S ribosomal protein L19e [Nanoarchaeota archaeon]|nr:50S ribosomal protein L19e [Nanoarchaeota archaeon]MBU1269145.1 50S ribosomal protein L19e [Nanoarchaeota archaeon]MBU1605107.1 50S ribosomal protein L19e [Nanoarchaeota archaeon]MBU2442788.1 50S ribosomal protein L19e [Nanoarchaeota archaeon]
MRLKTQKKLAASVLKASSKRVVFNPERLEDIKEAITKTDIRGLIADDAIILKQKRGTSKVRVRERNKQRRKGLRKGPSTRKGKITTRTANKDTWKIKIRTQRAFLKTLRGNALITKKTYSDLYLKAKGNFFRSKRHIQIYLEDHNLIKKSKK